MFCAAGFFTLSYFFASSEGICIIFLALCALEDNLDLVHQSISGEIFKICVWKTLCLDLFIHCFSS